MTRTHQLLLAQATVAAGQLLLVLGITVHLHGPWSAGYGLGLLTAWGALSVPLAHTIAHAPAPGTMSAYQHMTAHATQEDEAR